MLDRCSLRGKLNYTGFLKTAIILWRVLTEQAALQLFSNQAMVCLGFSVTACYHIPLLQTCWIEVIVVLLTSTFLTEFQSLNTQMSVHAHKRTHTPTPPVYKCAAKEPREQLCSHNPLIRWPGTTSDRHPGISWRKTKSHCLCVFLCMSACSRKNNDCEHV